MGAPRNGSALNRTDSFFFHVYNFMQILSTKTNGVAIEFEPWLWCERVCESETMRCERKKSRKVIFFFVPECFWLTPEGNINYLFSWLFFCLLKYNDIVCFWTCSSVRPQNQPHSIIWTEQNSESEQKIYCRCDDYVNRMVLRSFMDHGCGEAAMTRCVAGGCVALYVWHDVTERNSHLNSFTWIKQFLMGCAAHARTTTVYHHAHAHVLFVIKREMEKLKKKQKNKNAIALITDACVWAVFGVVAFNLCHWI